MRFNKFLFFSVFVIIIISFFIHISAQENAASWPKRVLITNDNGIEDVKIVELARAFSPIAETYVVAPREDRSGSTHYLKAIREGTIKVQKRRLGKGIHAYAVDGFPADCVLFALCGIMKDTPPDLVISGINGGPNLGEDWIFSGTIGAARIAAFAGFPAIAVSGLSDRMPDAVKAATQWVVRLAQSSIVRELTPLQYLTVSIPRVPPSKIKGIKVAKRASVQDVPIYTRIYSDKRNREVWQHTGSRKIENSLLHDDDLSLYKTGYVVIVPMKADEHDLELLSLLKNNLDKLPSWSIE